MPKLESKISFTEKDNRVLYRFISLTVQTSTLTLNLSVHLVFLVDLEYLNY
jgi:hypothetical protein